MLPLIISKEFRLLCSWSVGEATCRNEYVKLGVTLLGEFWYASEILDWQIEGMEVAGKVMSVFFLKEGKE